MADDPFELPKWVMKGVLTDIRERKTKTGEVWTHSAKMLSLGGAFEIMDRKGSVLTAKGVQDGARVVAVGQLVQSGSYLNLVVTELRPAS